MGKSRLMLARLKEREDKKEKREHEHRHRNEYKHDYEEMCQDRKISYLVDEIKDVIECFSDIMDIDDYDGYMTTKARRYGGSRGRQRDSMGRFKNYEHKMDYEDMPYDYEYMGYPIMMAYNSPRGYGGVGMGNYRSGYNNARMKAYGMDYYPMEPLGYEQTRRMKAHSMNVMDGKEHKFDEHSAKEWVSEMDYATGEKGGK